MGTTGPDGHDRRVAELCVMIGRELGMTSAEQVVLSRSGLLHDVGKLGIPQSILDKQGALTESEWRVMKTHPELGIAILGGTGRITREMLGVLYHHERMDGSGYPHGLASAEIPIEARIVAVADTYDVLTTDRPYRQAVSPSEALVRVLDDAGPRLDPVVVAALHRILGAYRRNLVA
ncbi:MAG TPA: HD-GYP domain-containing protein [Candidatus Dormibacteraeota bacterium]|nr:HD-GYP domain-containing protein [Candidatus Dormibacteraeota bacterium]